MPVLINYLNIYFSHPERSVQRSQVVQNVVTILSPTNKHWSHRTVRLWFNNNKRVYFRSPSPSPGGSYSPPVSEPKKENVPFQPPRNFYVPPRSMSVMNHHEAPQVLQQQKPQKESFAQLLDDQKVHVMENQDMISESERLVTEKISAMRDQKWTNLVSGQSSVKSEIDPFSLKSNQYPPPPQNTFSIPSFVPSELIEASLIFPNGNPALVIFSTQDQQRHLLIDDRDMTLFINSPVLSMVCDTRNGILWLHIDTQLRSISLENLEFLSQFSTDQSPAIRSAMIISEEIRASKKIRKLILASGSHITTWEINSQNPSALDFHHRIMQTIPYLSSMAQVGHLFVVGSPESHTPHLYDQQGVLVARSIGHVSGITAIAPYDHNCFLTGSADCTVKLWDQRMANPAISFMRHRSFITSIAGNPVSNIVLTGGLDRLVKCWDCRTIGSKAYFTSMSTGYSSPMNIGFGEDYVSVISSEVVDDTYFDIELLSGFDVPPEDIPPNCIIRYQLNLSP